jgi:hypothetical protein
MKKDNVIILCKLEKICPLLFFDVMVHLAVHLPYEAQLRERFYMVGCIPLREDWASISSAIEQDLKDVLQRHTLHTSV